MDKPVEKAFLMLIKDHATICQKSINQVNECLKYIHTGQNSPENIDLLFMFIQFFLSNAAIISKIFWPEDRGSPTRGQDLRVLFGLPDDPHFQHALHNREIRNFFDHIDERLDRWARDYPKHNIIYKSIGQRSAISIDDIQAIFLFFNIPTLEIYCLGERFQVGPVAEEIFAIYEKVMKMVV